MVFGCFAAPGGMPRGAPETWTCKQVKQWLRHCQLERYAELFAAVTGKALMAFDWNKLKHFAQAPSMPAELLEAVNELRLDWNMAPLREPAPDVPVPETQAEPPLAPSLEEHLYDAVELPDNQEALAVDVEEVVQIDNDLAGMDAETEDDGCPPEADMEVKPVADEMVQLEVTDRVTEESVAEPPVMPEPVSVDRVTMESLAEPEPKPVQPSFMHMQEVVAGVRDWALILQPYTMGMTVETVVVYLEGLGKAVGGGLATAAAMQPSYGEVFGAAISLEAMASRAGVARDNCSKAAGLAADVLRILDAAWKKSRNSQQAGPTISDDVLCGISNRFKVLEASVQPFTVPGWLLEVCCNERMKERFDAAHNGVVDALKRLGMDILPGGRPLARGDYRDLPRHVRRLVRQQGSGSITSGLMNLKASGVQYEGLKELAGLLGLGGHEEVLGPSLVMTELEALPTSGMDVEVYYNSLVVGVNGGESVGQVFDWYDKENTGYIDMARFQCVLSDLGLLDGKTEVEANLFVNASFRAADTRNEGVLQKDSFCAYYATLTTSRARQQLRTRMGLAVEEELRRVFVGFASFGSRSEVQDIDNARFFKLTKDCALTSSNLTSTDVDLIFTKAKHKGARRMNFEQFLSALSMCCDKKGISLDDAVRKVLATGGPVAHATKPDTVRLHDDKSTYTGVYAKGGPKAVDAPKNDLSSILDRSEADVRGVKKNVPPPKAAPSMKTAAMSARRPPMSSPPPEFLRSSMGPGAALAAGLSPTPTMVSVSRRQSFGSSAGGAADLREMFSSFALFGTATNSAGFGNGPIRVEMDSSRFQKLCRECRLHDKGFNASRADLIFTKVKQQGHNKIGYAEFERAMHMVAEAKGCAVSEVTAAVCNSDGPLLTRMMQG